MSHALVILCGGKSSRMGTDKTFLPFGADSLLIYQIRRFQPYFPKIYLSIQDKTNKQFDYQAYTGCEEIPDLYPGIGPIGGIFSSLSYAKEDVLYFQSVDAPFSSPQLAADMCGRLEVSPESGACLLCNPQGKEQPLPAAYSRSCRPVIQTLIEEKRYALRGIFDRIPPIILRGFYPEIQFFNMNRPQDYYFALQQHASVSPAEYPVSFTERTAPVRNQEIPVISFTARSGTGKTTYLEKLIPLLKEKHLRIAVLKHDAHGFQMDKPGKDSYRFTAAGADHVILTSQDQTASIISHTEDAPALAFLLSKIQNVDLIITEGFKLETMPKIELLRKGYQEIPISNPENRIALIADFEPVCDIPVFDLNQPESILPFLLEYLQK